MSSLILFGGVFQVLYGTVLFLTSLFLILLVLIQRGRGGGLSGAFGGMGGQSAFGAKAGDTFTRITIGAATFWIVLCLFGVKFMGSQAVASKFVDEPAAAPSAPLDNPTGTADEAGAEGEAAPEGSESADSSEEPAKPVRDTISASAEDDGK